MSYEKQIWNKYDDMKTEEENIQNGAVLTDDRMNHIEEGIATHTSDTNNPHNVTPTQIGLDKVENVKQASKVEFDSHTSNKFNPHNVTAAQVGLGNVDNVQQAAKTDFDFHVNNKANPHAVTASQVGAYSKMESDSKLAELSASVVHNTGDEIIAGNKKFTGVVTFQNSIPTSTDILEMIWPIGSVYTSYVNQNPGDLFGLGRWERIKGRMVVGVSESESEFSTVGKTGGEKTHVLSANEMPRHGHTDSVEIKNASSEAKGYGLTQTGGFRDRVIINNSGKPTYTGSAGGGAAHNNLPPYIALYMWRRIA